MDSRTAQDGMNKNKRAKLEYLYRIWDLNDSLTRLPARQPVERPQLIKGSGLAMMVLLHSIKSSFLIAMSVGFVSVAWATTVNMQTGLKGESVTVSSGNTLATGVNTLDIEAGTAGITTTGTGTLNATNGTITCAGKFLNSATGTFTSTGSTVTFDAAGGTPTIDSGGDAFNTLTVNATGVTYTVSTSNISAASLTLTAGTLDMSTLDVALTANLLINGGTLTGSNAACDIDVDGNVTVSSGTLTAPAAADDSSFLVGGSWNVSGTGTFTPSSGRILFDAGAIGKTIVTTSSGADDFYDVKFNNAAGGWTASDAMEVVRDISVAAGAFTAPSAANLTVTGNFDVAGTFTHNSGTVVLNGAAASNQRLDVNGTLSAGSVTFYNFSATTTAARTITLDDLDTVTVTNSLTLQGASAQLLTFTSDDGVNTVDFDYTKAGTGTQTVSYVTATRIDSDTGVDIIYDSTNSPTITSCVGWKNIAVAGGAIFIWDGATSTAWNNANNWDVGALPGTASNVTIPNVSNPPSLDQARTANAVTIQIGGTLNLNEYALSVTGTLSNSGILNASGAAAPFSAGTMTNNAGSLVNYTGVAADTAVNVVAGTYDDLTVNNAGTGFRLQGDVTVNDDLAVTAGTLDTDSNGDAVGGTVSNMAVKGNANFMGTFNARGASTVTLFNDGVDEIKILTTGSNAFQNLIINHTASTTKTARVSGALDIDGTFTLSAGVLDLATNNVVVNVAGNVSIANGASVTKATSSAWTFDGTTQAFTDNNVTKQNLGVVVI